MAILANVVTVVTSTCMNRDIVNALINNSEPVKPILVALLYQLLYIFITVLDISVNFLYLNKKYVGISAELNKCVFNKAISAKYEFLDDPEYYDNYSWSIREYVNQSDNAVELIKKILVSFFSFTTLITVFATTSKSWVVLVVTMVYLIIMIPLDKKLSTYNVDKKKELLQHNRKLDYIQRVFFYKEYAELLRISLMPSHLSKWYDEIVSMKMNLQDKYNRKIGSISIIQMTIQYVATFLIMAFYIFQVFADNIGVGDFIALVSAAALTRKILYNFTSHYKSFNEIALHSTKIKIFFDSDDEEYNNDGLVIKSDPCSIEFQNVSFEYNTGIGVSNINIHINPGEKIAIVGNNGAGKTTLVKLLVGLYKPQNGAILVDGLPIDNYELKSYRLCTGVALQDTKVFAMSIRDNMSRYKYLNDGEIKNILSRMSLDRIDNQANGDYSIPFLRDFDKNGIELSGGERQKIAVGSLLCKSFPLLILDEPTSALDPIAEFEFNQLITSKTISATTIIISHRLSAIKNVDRIFVLCDGAIVESGTHDELYNNRSLYYEMFQKQSSMYC